MQLSLRITPHFTAKLLSIHESNYINVYVFREAKNGDIEMNGKTKRVRIVHPCPTAEERNEASQIPESSVVSSLKQDSSPVERRFTL